MISFLHTQDDMDWLFQVHLKGFGLKREYYQSAIIYGNEDSPDSIALYQSACPTINDEPLKIMLTNPIKSSGLVSC